MHSGYPMMGFVSALHVKNEPTQRGPLMTTTEMKKKGSWGPFHEIGHNHQWNR